MTDATKDDLNNGEKEVVFKTVAMTGDDIREETSKAITEIYFKIVEDIISGIKLPDAANGKEHEFREKAGMQLIVAGAPASILFNEFARLLQKAHDKVFSDFTPAHQMHYAHMMANLELADSITAFANRLAERMHNLRSLGAVDLSDEAKAEFDLVKVEARKRRRAILRETIAEHAECDPEKCHSAAHAKEELERIDAEEKAAKAPKTPDSEAKKTAPKYTVN